MVRRNRSLRWGSVRLATSALAVTLMATQVAGCFPVALGAFAATSYAATDRRTLAAQADDKAIGLKGGMRISDALGDTSHVNVTSYNRRILLTGEVPDEAAKQKAEQVVAGLENNTGVVNELQVSGVSSFASRSSDALITTRVKAQLVDNKDIFGNAFKVITERGTVYLMGRVTQREGDRAAEIARSTSGVLRVVKVFDYISEDELKKLQTQPAPPPPESERN